LQHTSWQPPLYFSGASSPHFSLSLADGNTLLVTAVVGGGPFGPAIQILDNTVTMQEPSFDRNSNENALEIVTANGEPIFQLIFKSNTHILVNGFFPVQNHRPMLASPEHVILEAGDEEIAKFHLKPIFKYLWKYPGQYAE